MQANRQLIMGVVLGIALGICIGLMIFYIQRNPHKARKILVSFLCVEVLISVRIGFDSFDFYTESPVQTGCFSSTCIFQRACDVMQIRSLACIIGQRAAALFCSYMFFKEVLPQRSNPNVADLAIPWMCCYSISSVVRELI